MDVYTFSHLRFYIHCFLFEKNLAKRQILLFFPFSEIPFSEIPLKKERTHYCRENSSALLSFSLL